MHIRTVMRHLLIRQEAIDGKHRQLRRCIIQRVDQRPIGYRHQRAIAAQIVARYAVILPHFHRHHGRHQHAVAKEEHIVVLRLFQITAQEISAFLSHKHFGKQRDNPDSQDQKEQRLCCPQPESFLHHFITLCTEHAFPAALPPNNIGSLYRIMPFTHNLF